MIDFKKYFNDEYQFALINAVYSQLDNRLQGAELELNIEDSINANVRENHMEVTFRRKVFFEPEALYSIDVTFAFMLTFRDGNLATEAQNIDWGKELIENDNPYLGNVVSRASFLIATLTSSYGQQPLVTPPNVIRQ